MRRKRHRNLQQTFDADILYSKNRLGQTDMFFPASSREEEHGVVGVFFWRYASDDDDAIFLSLSLSSRFEDDDDSFSLTTTASKTKEVVCLFRFVFQFE